MYRIDGCRSIAKKRAITKGMRILFRVDNTQKSIIADSKKFVVLLVIIFDSLTDIYHSLSCLLKDNYKKNFYKKGF